MKFDQWTIFSHVIPSTDLMHNRTDTQYRFMSQSKEQIYMAGTPVLFSKWGKKKKKTVINQKQEVKFQRKSSQLDHALIFKFS